MSTPDAVVGVDLEIDAPALGIDRLWLKDDLDQAILPPELALTTSISGTRFVSTTGANSFAGSSGIL